MLEVKKILNISDEEFFAVLKDSLLRDMGKEGEELEVKAGIKYGKTLMNRIGKSGKVQVELVEYQYPTVYASKISTEKNDNYLTFKVDKLEENKIEVTYTESFESSSKANSTNQKIMEFIYKRGSIKRMNNTLIGAERYAKYMKEENKECQD